MKTFLDEFFFFGLPFMIACLISIKSLKKFSKFFLTLNREKFQFMVKKEIVLGHVISEDGIKVRVKTDMKEVRSFLGYVGFYCCFMKDFSKIEAFNQPFSQGYTISPL